MEQLKNIQSEIDQHSHHIEEGLSLSEITIKYGLNSYRYGSSSFLGDLFDPIPITDKTVFYDLGSGYGNIILYGAVKYPDTQFIGIEILEERNKVCVDLIEKEGITNVRAISGDILKTDVSDGNVFYLYNPLYDFQYTALLDKLYQISLNKTIIVIAESRCIFFDEAQWLEQYHFKDIDVIRKIKYYRSKSAK
ncbi:tRNA (guanine-N(7)-)-methyltransferase [Flavobacterium sp. JAS]|uniref:tRNA (guanine-N(7)-)-methyltransferase n=1 Tax=Flavobacterium sp. JAS TaxID=2897329 RepID=UPI001E3C60BB|nr:tRNA (guanine-N(7)-)-methyltransferase [Flavobacterium sp. JAS]MCD0470956.1 tRNA (guanine-N(7)-)-methyltransferase [Flavobacterium sp. JAS]